MKANFLIAFFYIQPCIYGPLFLIRRCLHKNSFMDVKKAFIAHIKVCGRLTKPPGITYYIEYNER